MDDKQLLDEFGKVHTRINKLQKDTFGEISEDRIKTAVIESNLNNHLDPDNKCQKAQDEVGEHYKDEHKGSILRMLTYIFLGSGALFGIAKVLESIVNH